MKNGPVARNYQQKVCFGATQRRGTRPIKEREAKGVNDVIQENTFKWQEMSDVDSALAWCRWVCHSASHRMPKQGCGTGTAE
jgi:hypothetical protein